MARDLQEKPRAFSVEKKALNEVKTKDTIMRKQFVTESLSDHETFCSSILYYYC